jgi:phospholipid-binding lipoprotein MlaA
MRSVSDEATPRSTGRPTALWAGLVIAGLLSAAAPVANAAPDVLPQISADEAGQTATPYDPWQGFNRHVFSFSMGLDRYLLAPITHGYMRVTPEPIRNRVSAVVYNLGEPGTALNDVAQGHPKRAGVTTSRFVINSTVGLLGLFDVAAGMGLPSHDADFGQTLGRYGAQAGPYFYVPIIGPLDMRDGFGRVVDFFTDPVSLFTGGITTPFGATRTGLTAIDTRALGDPAYKALEDATDPYATARSAFTQHRAFVVQRASGKVVELPDFDTTPPQP